MWRDEVFKKRPIKGLNSRTNEKLLQCYRLFIYFQQSLFKTKIVH